MNIGVCIDGVIADRLTALRQAAWDTQQCELVENEYLSETEGLQLSKEAYVRLMEIISSTLNVSVKPYVGVPDKLRLLASKHNLIILSKEGNRAQVQQWLQKYEIQHSAIVYYDDIRKTCEDMKISAIFLSNPDEIVQVLEEDKDTDVFMFKHKYNEQVLSRKGILRLHVFDDWRTLNEDII